MADTDKDLTDEEVEALKESNPLSTAAISVAAGTIRAVMRLMLTEAGVDPDSLDNDRLSVLGEAIMIAGMTAGAATVLEEHRQRYETKKASPAFQLLMALDTETVKIYTAVQSGNDTAMRTYVRSLSEEMRERTVALGLSSASEEEP